MNLIKNMDKVEIVVVLIGNKAERESERCVTFEEGREMAKKFKLRFFEISS